MRRILMVVLALLLITGAFLAGQLMPQIGPELWDPMATRFLEMREVTVVVYRTVQVPVIVRVAETVVVPLAITPAPGVVECLAIGAYLKAMAEVQEERSDILEDESRWREKSSEQSAEVVKERCTEFWERWRDLWAESGSVSPPALLRKAHDDFQQSMEQKLRSLEYLQAYYQTGLESDRAKSNEALTRANRFAQDYGYEVDQVMRLCSGE